MTSPTVAAESGSTDMWGTLVSAMQSDVAVADGAITGTLTKLTSGQLVTDWGEGYFLALKFTNNDDNVTSIKVGLDPSQGSGLVELDEDMNGVFKITDKSKQKFVVDYFGGVHNVLEFDLSGLTLSE